jgi:hypothetical protein
MTGAEHFHYDSLAIQLVDDCHFLLVIYFGFEFHDGTCSHHGTLESADGDFQSGEQLLNFVGDVIAGVW